MILAVYWTAEALETFEHVISAIETKWGTIAAEKFVRSTYKIINLIVEQPYLFKSSRLPDTRLAVITK